MTIQEYMRILRRRGWIILAAAIICAALAYGVSTFQKELYSATVNVSAVPARPDLGLGTTAKDMLRNFAENIKTPENAQSAIERAQLDMNPYEFLGKLQVEADSSTYTIKIEARNADPEVAKLMALTIADDFVEERTQYYAQLDKSDRIEVKVRSRAIDTPLVQPKPLLNAVAGAVLGILLGVALVLALSWMEADLLRTPVAVERALGLPVLGVVPAATSSKESNTQTSPIPKVPTPKTA